MIRTILISAWVTIATVGALFASVTLFSDDGGAPLAAADEIEELESRHIAVPVLAGQRVTGYFIAKVGYSAHASEIGHMVAPMDAVVRHSLHAVIYRHRENDYSDPGSVDTESLAAAMVADLNRRLDREAVTALELREIDYLPRESH
ncbi:MAG: hypothetical protein R3D45_10640 [Rhizobiaceae bacterium]